MPLATNKERNLTRSEYSYSSITSQEQFLPGFLCPRNPKWPKGTPQQGGADLPSAIVGSNPTGDSYLYLVLDMLKRFSIRRLDLDRALC